MTFEKRFTSFAATTAIAGVALWAHQSRWLMATTLAISSVFLTTARLTAFRGPHR